MAATKTLVPLTEVRYGEVVALRGPALMPIMDHRREYNSISPGNAMLKDQIGIIKTDSKSTSNRYVYVNVLENGNLVSRGVDNTKAAVLEVLSGGDREAFLKQLNTVLTPSFETYIKTGVGVTTGSDPECFVLDGAGAVMPAFNFLTSKAASPNGTYWDGFQAEFVVTPATCHEVHLNDVQTKLWHIWTAALRKDPKATLTYKTVLPIPEAMMASVSDAHAALGCSPSLNAYPDEIPLNVPDGRMLPFRFAGFHVHHGLKGITPELVAITVKAMDNIAGVLSVSLLDGLEHPARRQFYGRAGEYRLPPHGLEYRVLSSALLAHPVITFFMLDMVRYAGCLAANHIYDAIWKSPGDAVVRSIINEYDVVAAREVLAENEKVILRMLKGLYGAYNSITPTILKRMFDGPIMQGIAKHMNIKDDISQVWGITPTNARAAAIQRAHSFIAGLLPAVK